VNICPEVQTQIPDLGWDRQHRKDAPAGLCFGLGAVSICNECAACLAPSVKTLRKTNGRTENLAEERGGNGGRGNQGVEQSGLWAEPSGSRGFESKPQAPLHVSADSLFDACHFFRLPPRYPQRKPEGNGRESDKVLRLMQHQLVIFTGPALQYVHSRERAGSRCRGMTSSASRILPQPHFPFRRKIRISYFITTCQALMCRMSTNPSPKLTAPPLGHDTSNSAYHGEIQAT